MFPIALAESSIQLVPDGTLILHVILILVMVYVLNQTMFKPINKILEERERLTKGQLGAAGDILQRVDEGAAKYERGLYEARTEGYKLLEQERATAMAERQQKLDETREEIVKVVAKEKDSIRVQADKAAASIESTAQSLATEIGSTILRRPL